MFPGAGVAGAASSTALFCSDVGGANPACPQHQRQGKRGDGGHPGDLLALACATRPPPPKLYLRIKLKVCTWHCSAQVEQGETEARGKGSNLV